MLSVQKRLGKKTLAVYFLAFVLAFVFLFGHDSASAITQRSSFLNAETWRLEELQFSKEDVDNGLLDKNDLRALSPANTEEAGLAELNRRLQEWTPIEFVDAGPYDSEQEYVGGGIGCGNESKLARTGNNWILTQLSILDGENDCENILNSSILNNSSAGVLFQNSSETDYWRSISASFSNENTIVIIGSIQIFGADIGDQIQFTATNPAFPDRYFLAQGSGGQYIDLDGSPDGNNVYDATVFNFGDFPSRIKVAGPDSVANVDNASQNQGGVTGVDPLAPDGCEGSGPFSFILCPIISGIDEGINVLDNEIREALNVDSDYYNADETRLIWSRIRDIAYILLIPIMLVMVISTALGFQFVDAYTVKRAMPRLFAAVIFMVLSYDIGVIMIEVFNTIGQGVGGIIAAPFGGAENLVLDKLFSPSQGEAAGVFATGGVLAGITLITALSTGIIASYLLVAVVTLVIIFVLLTVREILIIALLILGPLAILSWIFPGNDKLWKLWWGSFTKLLYVYPIVVGLLMLGRGFAFLVNSATADQGLSGVEQAFFVLVKLVAYTGPFFFILTVFKYAGGAFANLAGMANDRSKGLFDRQKKYRAEKRAGIKKDLASRNRFKSLGQDSKINKALQTPFAIKEAGWAGVKSRGAREAAAKQLIAAGKKDAKEDYILQERMQNDIYAEAIKIEDSEERMNFLRANNYSGGDARRTSAEIEKFQRDYGTKNLAKMAVIAKAGSKTSYTGGIDEMLEEILEVTGGDMTEAGSLLAQAGAAAQQAGVYHLSKGSFGDKFDAMAQLKGAKVDAAELARQGRTSEAETLLADTSRAINSKQIEKTIDSMTAYDYHNLHPTAAKRVAEGYTVKMQTASAALQAAQSAGDQEAVALQTRALGQAAAGLQQVTQGTLQSGNAESARILADAFEGEFIGGAIDFAGSGPGGTQGISFSSPNEMREYVSYINQELSKASSTNPDIRASAAPISAGQKAFAEGFSSVQVRGMGLSPEDIQRQQELSGGGGGPDHP